MVGEGAVYVVLVQVAPKLLERFNLAQLQGLRGHNLEVRGWVVDRAQRGTLRAGQARWLLPLTDPSMLEVLQ